MENQQSENDSTIRCIAIGREANTTTKTLKEGIGAQLHSSQIWWWDTNFEFHQVTVPFGKPEPNLELVKSDGLQVIEYTPRYLIVRRNGKPAERFEATPTP